MGGARPWKLCWYSVSVVTGFFLVWSALGEAESERSLISVQVNGAVWQRAAADNLAPPGGQRAELQLV